MSESTLIVFRDGIPTDYFAARNGWGTGPAIWFSLTKKYAEVIIPDFNQRHQIRNPWDDVKKLYEAINTGKLALRAWEHAALMWTSDDYLVSPAAAPAVADALDQFHEAHCAGLCISHLPAFAKKMRELAGSVSAFGLWPTSVSDNPWVACRTRPDPNDPGADEDYEDSYNHITGTRHKWVPTQQEARITQ